LQNVKVGDLLNSNLRYFSPLSIIFYSKYIVLIAASIFIIWPRILNRKEDRAIELSATATPAVLQVEGLCFRYPQRALFTDWSARIPPGVSLVRGGDGSGKTTLLRLLAGELPADAGHLQLNDVVLSGQPNAYRQQMFWVDPRSDAFDQMTPVDYFQSQQRLHSTFDQHELADLIAGLSLAPHLDKHLYMLSTGSKRKVWLAAAFASGAAVTLLDEPFAALDKPSVGFVMELLAAAADYPARACVIADYEAPGDVPLAAIIDLGD
jgi:ABC-type multidrug transport system ATPase subunit